MTAVIGESGEEASVNVVVNVIVPVTNEEIVVALALEVAEVEATDDILEEDSGPGEGR